MTETMLAMQRSTKSVSTDYSFDMVDARLLGRYFHLFQRMPSTIDTDFFVRMNVLSRITPGLLPPDEDLVESLSKRPILGNGFSNWASYIARLQGAPTPSKTANNFVRQYGRWPLNSEELHRGEPFPVRLSRFGITIPYDTMIVPPKDAAEATGTSGIAINEVGFLGCSEKGGLTLSSKLCLQWDPTHKEFCEARFFNMPYKESPDGLQRLIARASLSKGYEAITDLAREIEGLTGFCLSAKAFDSLVRVYKETFFKGASAPDSSPFYWYDVSRRIIVIGGNKSQTRGIPVNLPQAVFEGHLLTAKKFLTVDQAVTLQKTLYANPLDVAGRLTKKVNSQMVGRDR